MNRVDPLLVECPFCGIVPRQSCVDNIGTPVPPHYERKAFARESVPKTVHVNTQGRSDWSAWTHAYPDATDTFKMRVPGGWLVRVFDEEKPTYPASIRRCLPMDVGGDQDYVFDAPKCKSHVLFIPDPSMP